MKNIIIKRAHTNNLRNILPSNTIVVNLRLSEEEILERMRVPAISKHHIVWRVCFRGMFSTVCFEQGL